MMSPLLWYLDPVSPHQLKNVKFGPPLTKLSEPAHANDAKSILLCWQAVAYSKCSCRVKCKNAQKSTKGFPALWAYFSSLTSYM